MLIYKATTPSGKCYIGLTTKTLTNRKKDHKRHSSKNKGNRYYNKPFYKAIRKYGWDNIFWEILFECNDLNLLKKKEIYYIKKFNSFKNGYNCTLGSDGLFGYKFTEDQKKLISKRTKEAMKDPNIRKKCARGGQGRIPKNRKKVMGPNGEKYKSLSEAAKSIGVSIGTLSRAINHGYKTKGMIFKYV